MKFRARFILGILCVCCQSFIPQIGFTQDTFHCLRLGSVGNLSQLLSSITYKCEPGFASEKDLIVIATSTGNPSLESYKDFNVDEKIFYIFDAYADGTPNLIISFIRTKDYFIANLYDDQNNDGQVSYSLFNGEILINEGPHWTMQVISVQPWVGTSGIISYNLDVWIDGEVNANWLSTQYLSEFSTDGRIDFYIKVRDTDQDGSPDYEIRQSYQTEDYWYVPSTWLGVSEQRQDPPIKNALIWPYLGSGHFDFFQQFNNFYAPIQMDWMKGKIVTLVEFVPSHEGDDVWYMQSLHPFGENNEAYANFENPVCWIDLAGDHDGYPELHIRQEYYGMEDEYHWYDIPESYKNDIRYTWDQNNDQSWDFKIGLSGSYPIDQLVTFPEFAAKTIPCKQFPGWITSKRWGPAVFVASYIRNFAEGIYEWGTVDRDLERFLFGYEKKPDIFTKLSIGYRGEYTYNLNEQPWLYLHPIDHMLHLKGSEAGFYQISDRKRLNYTDQDADGYVDHWSLYESDNLQSIMVIENDYAIYYDYLYENLLVKQLTNSNNYQSFLPPRDHKEWDELAQKIGDDYEQGDINLQTWILEAPGVFYSTAPAILRSFHFESGEPAILKYDGIGKNGTLENFETKLSVIEFEKPGFMQLYSLPEIPDLGNAVVLLFLFGLVLFGGAIFIKIVKE